MKNIKSVFYTISVIIIAFCIFSCSKDEVTQTQKSLATILDETIERRQQINEPGISVLIKHNSDIIYSNSRGLARIAGNYNINQDTGFRIGSITKPMTALSIMMLVERNQISLDDKLLDILPFLSQAYSDIKIEHLLTHRSGLLDYIDDNTNISSLDGLTTAQVPSIIASSGLENLQFTPGTSGRYSNTGYVFLAMIIEEISGLSYPDFLNQNIFNPLGMVNSFVISENLHLGDVNNNYALNFGNSIKVKGFDSLIYGASGIVSSVNDLNLFIEALLSYQIVSKQMLETMIQPRGALSGIADYGLGWMTGTGNGYWHQAANLTDVNDFWHIGGFDGYRTVISINPDMNLEFIILTNNGNESQELSNEIMRITRNYLKNE